MATLAVSTFVIFGIQIHILKSYVMQKVLSLDFGDYFYPHSCSTKYARTPPHECLRFFVEARSDEIKIFMIYIMLTGSPKVYVYH